MEKLRNPIMPYAWGSRSAIAGFLGRPVPSDTPEAEMWIGAHPLAPSVLETSGRPLTEHIATAPRRELGEGVASRFEGRLPFLLKVLAADQPLSLQAHPSPEQARAGFEREEGLGIPRDAPERCYRDASHKPEILLALSPFTALCGFRPARRTLELMALLGGSALTPLEDALRRRPNQDGLREAFGFLMDMPAGDRRVMVDSAMEACRDALGRAGAWRRELECALALAGRYPGDPGAVTSLLLNLVELAPGEAMYLPAGNLHSYLGGTGVELMANSDNVLRGGLTGKHVDVPELSRILSFADEPFAPTTAVRAGQGYRHFATDAEDFRLAILEVEPGLSPTLPHRGGGIVLVLAGRIRLEGGGRSLDLTQGDAAWLPDHCGAVTATGHGKLAAATVGDIDGCDPMTTAA